MAIDDSYVDGKKITMVSLVISIEMHKYWHSVNLVDRKHWAWQITNIVFLIENVPINKSLLNNSMCTRRKMYPVIDIQLIVKQDDSLWNILYFSYEI